MQLISTPIPTVAVEMNPPVVWSRENHPTLGENPRVLTMAEREHTTDASAASLSEVRDMLLRVAHRLSSLEEVSSPSKYLNLIFLLELVYHALSWRFPLVVPTSTY